ncbi:MAG: Panacea domain-containing protein [Sphingobacteriales bacterium JAD_PAG50586_3]|nr:MAG: Panacea domain-containing protein [Sphingobacteriales bacterium JAD_PAG50586_3]
MGFNQHTVKFTDELKSKLGNTLVFLTDRLGWLNKTQILKLVYIIEKLSVKKLANPFFNLNFEVWQYGPVSVDLYNELSDGPELLQEYIRATHQPEGILFNKLQGIAFDDSEFSDTEIQLLENVCKNFNASASKLVEITHDANDLWVKTAERNGILSDLLSGKLKTTSYSIDLSELLNEEPTRKELYIERVHSVEVLNNMK